MEPTGELRVSERGEISLPAATRRRWSLNSGGRVACLDFGDALVIVPQGVGELRNALLEGITDDVWSAAATGFGDTELTTE